jgi:hypothetical protein
MLLGELEEMNGKDIYVVDRIFFFVVYLTLIGALNKTGWACNTRKQISAFTRLDQP